MIMSFQDALLIEIELLFAIDYILIAPRHLQGVKICKDREKYGKLTPEESITALALFLLRH